jgi:hypothetical protein
MPAKKTNEIQVEVLKDQFKGHRFYLHTHSQKEYWQAMKVKVEECKDIRVEGGDCTVQDFFSNERVIYLVLARGSPLIINKKDYVIIQLNKTEYRVELKKLPKINTIFSVRWE